MVSRVEIPLSPPKFLDALSMCEVIPFEAGHGVSRCEFDSRLFRQFGSVDECFKSLVLKTSEP